MAQRPALLAILLLAPSLARAQTTTTQALTVTESSNQDRIININECNGTVDDQLSFQWAASATSLGTFELRASNQANCPNRTADNLAETISLQGGLASSGVLTNLISVPSLLSQLAIGCPGARTAAYICLVDTATGSVAAAANLDLDLQTPPAPIADPPTPGDSALDVRWNPGQGSAEEGRAGSPTSFNIYCEENLPVDGAAPPITRRCASVTGGGTRTARIGNLANGTAYRVQVTALTRGGNESERSNTVVGTPIEVNDYWRLYRAAGGREQGGCATGGAGVAALLGLLPLVLRRRGRRP